MTRAILLVIASIIGLALVKGDSDRREAAARRAEKLEAAAKRAAQEAEAAKRLAPVLSDCARDVHAVVHDQVCDLPPALCAAIKKAARRPKDAALMPDFVSKCIFTRTGEMVPSSSFVYAATGGGEFYNNHPTRRSAEAVAASFTAPPATPQGPGEPPKTTTLSSVLTFLTPLSVLGAAVSVVQVLLFARGWLRRRRRRARPPWISGMWPEAEVEAVPDEPERLQLRPQPLRAFLEPPVDPLQRSIRRSHVDRR